MPMQKVNENRNNGYLLSVFSDLIRTKPELREYLLGRLFAFLTPLKRFQQTQ